MIEPILDHEFHDRSYGFRHGRSCHQALRRVEELLEAGHVYVVDADLKSYFDTIPKDRLLDLVQQKISDSRLLELIKLYLDQGILEELRTWTPEAGVPQGAVLSPVLSNLYLNPLDHRMAELGYQMVRYADDFVVLCRTPEEAQAALAEIQAWVAEAGLTLHPTKTQIVDVREQELCLSGLLVPRQAAIPPRQEPPEVHGPDPRADAAEVRRISGGDDRARSIARSAAGSTTFVTVTGASMDDYDSRLRQRLRRMLLKRHRRNPSDCRPVIAGRMPTLRSMGSTAWRPPIRFVQSQMGNY